jgi:hypothetical protein
MPASVERSRDNRKIVGRSMFCLVRAETISGGGGGCNLATPNRTPCGDRLEYLHRSKRRHKGNQSSQVLRDLDSRETALPRLSSNCTSKVQTRPLVRKGAP